MRTLPSSLIVALALVLGCTSSKITPVDCLDISCREEPPVAPAVDAGCVPNCVARLCGDDGCGGSCGNCQVGDVCDPTFQCSTPNCKGKSCGPDGAGGSCGDCASGLECDPSGKCVSCIPHCQGMECGEDGCGGVCGTCADDEYCSEAGSCEWTLGPTDTRTRYPIVLAHGMMGWQKMFGAIEYFYRVPEKLREGGATVFVTKVSGANDSTSRGQQLLAQIEEILAQSGATRVNIIAHSQGGLDARYVAGMRPDIVASVTTVGSPHQGSDFATWGAKHLPSDGLPGAGAAAMTGAIAKIIDLVSGADTPEDGQKSLYALSAAGAQEYNRQFPLGLPTTTCGQGPSHAGHIAFFSWCGVKPVTNLLDTSDPWLFATSKAFTGPNDGLVGQCSCHFGTVLKDDYKMNHLDEMNQFFGLTSPSEVSTLEVFREHVSRLRASGR